MKSHRGEAVVRDVLEAVREEIGTVGFRAMRIENIALRAEVAKTTIYRRWPKKEDLLFELLHAMMFDANKVLVETGSLREDLLAIARHVQERMTSAEGKAIGRMMMAERSEPEVERAVERVRETMVRIPLQMVEAARERGELAADVIPDVLLSTLVGSIHHRIFVRCQPVTPGYVEAVVDLLLKGASARARPRS